MYRNFFEIVFNTESVFLNPIFDYILIAILTIIFFGIAFKIVGSLYSMNIISGSDSGSFIHWGIRLGLVYLSVQVIIFVRDNWQTITTLLAALLILVIIPKAVSVFT